MPVGSRGRPAMFVVLFRRAPVGQLGHSTGPAKSLTIGAEHHTIRGAVNMQDGYLQAGDGVSHEYRLTGRFWILAIAIVFCAASSLMFRYSSNTEWAQYSGQVRALGIPRDQANPLLSIAFGVIGMLLLIRMIIAPWITRTVFITSGSLTICETKFSGRSNIAIPVAELHNVRRFVRQSYSQKSRRLTEWARQTVQFHYKDQVFTFCNSQFRSNSDFEDFSMRVGARTTCPQ